MEAPADDVMLRVAELDAPVPRLNDDGEWEHDHPAGQPSESVKADAPQGELSVLVTITV